MTTIAEREFLTGVIPSLLYKRTIDKSIISDIQVYQRGEKLRIELFVANNDPFHKKMRITPTEAIYGCI